MKGIKVSVIVPTRDRPEKLADTLACLKQQSFGAGEYEIVVVDDGSSPAVILPAAEHPRCTLVRLEGVERSTARNSGAAHANGDVLIFIDDDITVGHDFIETHINAHREWPGALVVGAVRLTDEALATPFGRFRQNLERRGTPRHRGLTSTRNFCTAANMSLSRDLFLVLGGFDASLSSGEDQDLALRHTARGGKIAFIPESVAIHNDNALDIMSYCRRVEWGSEHMIPFCNRYADWADNIERKRINGRIRWKDEPAAQSVRKLIKAVLAFRTVVAVMSAVASLIEHMAPQSRALNSAYRTLLGSHMFRGYRKGQLPAVSDYNSAAKGHNKAIAGVVFVAISVLVTVWVTLPTSDSVYRMDDWDYIAELNHLSFGDYLLRVNQDGQFNPLAKAVYGLFLPAFSYSNLPLALFNFVIGWTSILIWFAVLRRLKCWSLAGALAIVAIRLSYVGIVDVFWFPLQGALELVFLFFTAAIYLLLHRKSALAIWGCGLALFAGSLSWSSGLVPPFTVTAAFLVSTWRTEPGSSDRDRDVVVMLLLAVIAVTACAAVPRFAQSDGLGSPYDLAGVAEYFFWGGIVNGALSGMGPMLLPGPFHALFFLILAAGTGWVVVSRESRDRKIVVTALFLTQTALSLLVAAARWEKGALHSSSYRYVFMNVFLQLPLVAILIGIIRERLLRRAPSFHNIYTSTVLRRAVLFAGALPFIFGLGYSAKARSQVISLEKKRTDCLMKIIRSGSSEDCISQIYYRPDPEFVRRVWSMVKQRRAQLPDSGPTDSLLP